MCLNSVGRMENYFPSLNALSVSLLGLLMATPEDCFSEWLINVDLLWDSMIFPGFLRTLCMLKQFVNRWLNVQFSGMSDLNVHFDGKNLDGVLNLAVSLSNNKCLLTL